MNWTARTMVETFERKPGLNPASWKWGVGWVGGTPVQQYPRQTFAVSGDVAWSVDGPNPPVAASRLEAERAQLELWLNPHGFLKAARLPGANPRAVWRWELGEMGRDGPTTIPEKMTVVSITRMGKYRVDATINRENLLQRIHTWVADPVLGDLNYEHEFTNQSYVDAGNGVRFPTSWHHHEGWDDNYNTQTISAGHNGFGGTFKPVTTAGCDAAVPVPEAVRTGPPPDRVETQPDRARTMRIYYVQPLQHAEGMLMAYLPNETLLIEADLFDTHAGRPAGPSSATRSLVNMVRSLKLEVDRVVPIHGGAAPWSAVLAAAP